MAAPNSRPVSSLDQHLGWRYGRSGRQGPHIGDGRSIDARRTPTVVSDTSGTLPPSDWNRDIADSSDLARTGRMGSSRQVC
jgi:hypothetical protein